MIVQSLLNLYSRDLQKLHTEIEAYTSETKLWTIDGNILNSGGNLCLHLIGNLKTYIGNGLSEINYKRDREFEFAGKHVSRQKLLEDISQTTQIVHDALHGLTEEQLKGDFPILIWKEKTGMIFTLIHLHSHLNYHLGQINYHRRLIDME